jgi:hypothetical protein
VENPPSASAASIPTSRPTSEKTARAKFAEFPFHDVG